MMRVARLGQVLGVSPAEFTNRSCSAYHSLLEFASETACQVDADSRALTVHLCEKWSKAAAGDCGRAPQDSIAGGCDYGVLSRLGIELRVPPAARHQLWCGAGTLDIMMRLAKSAGDRFTLRLVQR